ncbi:MAG: ABC transporter ATP-binding protein [Alphaproteobacteria bacterium]|nr:MAG: ABC transporter ATP-binding protein [Alphaproteobacteria bacterium]
MLCLRDVDAFYGRAQVLFGLTLDVGTGEALALLGRNGAGKSTTLKSIMGLGPQVRGAITFRGRDIVGLPSDEIARLGIGYVPEDRRIFRDLTVIENLEVGRRSPPDDASGPPWTPQRLFDLFPNLATLRNRRGDEISGGEQQMLALARTLMGNPRLLLLDEPSEGLAPVIVEGMARAVAEIKAGGVSILLSEQNLAFARAIAERAAVIEHGRLRYAGTMAELMADAAIRHACLAV